jgi:uncharacterized membrane protein
LRRVISLIPPLAIALSVLASLAVYERLPAVVPIHWGIDGRPDGWASRGVGAFVLPAISLVLYLFLSFVRRSFMRAAEEEAAVRATRIVVAMVVVFFAFVHLAVLGTALGYPVDMVQLAAFGIGVMFIVIGLLMVDIPRNRWFGIRTPWTLRSERVWARTHRVAARWMVICGVALGLSSLLSPPWTVGVILLSVVVMMTATIGYSWMARDRD